MRHSISTHVFLQHRLHPGHLEAMCNGGAESIELFAARPHFDYTDRSAVRDIGTWFRSNPVSATLHQPLFADNEWSRQSGPTVNLIDVEKSRRIDAMDEVKRALEVAEQIPVESMVIHLGSKNATWSVRELEHSLTAIEHLKAFAGPLGVKLHLENLQNDVATPTNLLEILRVGHFNTVGVCLDIGHANLTDEGVAAAIEILGPRICQLHLHDNHGSKDGTAKDEHLWPLATPETGSVDWAEAMQKISALPANITGTLEIAYELDESIENASAKAAAAFSLLKKSAAE
ncbi:MAG: sugar phosphate isomerase/epimerase [Acidobacteriaceae bacterium]|jgi:sugar phosphate isomerase/epimerase|nr:sugar phosphate isomerase/epimerase [Acidobacteriaceae bacterium]